MTMECNVLVAQSGGPTTVINASLAGIISEALKEEQIDKIYGARNGIQGVLKEALVPLHELFAGKEECIEKLKITPSMFLGSCRYRLAAMEENPDEYEKIFRIFEKYQIRYFFYIGGNDSMDTTAKLSKYAEKIGYDITIMGIPKTIDNDLVEIDHTPGFGSAAKYIAASLLEIAHDTYIYNTKTVVIVEIMGRNAGWLTAGAALARTAYSDAPQLIYLPESAFSTAQFIQDIKKLLEDKDHIVVAVSEGIRDANGEYIFAKSTNTDQFGHVTLSGTGKYLEGLVQEKIGCKVRSIELSVLQRCAAHSASLTDINEAFLLGVHGVRFALAGHKGEMVCLKRVSESPYKVEYATVNVQKVANHEKMIPAEWIGEAGNDVTEKMLTYLAPLIEGEPEIAYKNGIPQYLFLDEMLR